MIFVGKDQTRASHDDAHGQRSMLVEQPPNSDDGGKKAKRRSATNQHAVCEEEEVQGVGPAGHKEAKTGQAAAEQHCDANTESVDELSSEYSRGDKAGHAHRAHLQEEGSKLDSVCKSSSAAATRQCQCSSSVIPCAYACLDKSAIVITRKEDYCNMNE